MLDIHPDDLEYPTSDGKPMAESDLHRDQMFLLIETLSDYFRGDPQVYVSGDILLFYQQGDKRKHLAPDVLVVLGIEKRPRNNYLLWREGKAPDVVFEVTSASTRNEDLGKKQRLCAMMGVQEYVLFDLRQEYLDPPLRLLRLAGDSYVPVVGKLFLETIGLELVVVDDQLRLVGPDGKLLPTRREALAEIDAALAEMDAALAEKDALRAEKDMSLAEKDTALVEKDRVLAEKDAALAESCGQLIDTRRDLSETRDELTRTRAALAEKDAALVERDRVLAEQHAALAEAERQRRAVEERLRELEG